MASKGRWRSFTLGLVTTALLALAWFSTPRWLPIVAEPLLGRSDIRIERLRIATPDADGIFVPEAILATPFGHVHATEARLRWDAAAGVSLHIAAVSIALGASPPDAAESGPSDTDPFAADLMTYLPGTLLSGLPFTHLRIDELTLTDRAQPASLRGHLEAAQTEALLTGTLTDPRLAEPISVDVSVSSQNEISLELAYGDARAVATATLARAAQALRLAGHLTFDGRTPERIALEGEVPFGLRLHAQAPSLTIQSGTALAMKTNAGDLRLASPQGFEISLDESKFASRGTLAATVNLARDLDAVPLANTRIDFRLENVHGRPAAPLAAIRIQMNSQALGELSAAAEVAPTSTHIAIASGAELSGTLRMSDGPTLEGLMVRTREATRIPLAAPASTLLQIIATAEHVRLGDVRLPLRGLEVDAHWTPSAAEANALSLTARAPGLEAQARIAMHAFGPTLTHARGHLDLASGFIAPLLNGIRADWLTAATGRIEFENLSWPVTTQAARIALSDLSAEGEHFLLRGLDLELGVAPDAGALAVSTTLATLAAVETEDGSLEAITFDAAASLPLSGPRFDTWTRTAALTRLELRVARGALAELPITALTLAGSGHWGEEANTLDVQVDLARIEAGVSVTNTTCALALQAEIASLDGCGAELLGGRISMPSARIDLSDGPTGYLPVALKGLDLGAILMLMQDEALDGSGTVDGALPLRFTHGVPTIEDGYVGARPPGGRLRYAAAAGLTASLNQPGLDLAIAALGDFRYERLGSYVDYGADGTLGLRMRLEGASPDVENGRPINFNLSVTQNLPLLLQSLRLSQNIGDAVERRLQERPDAP